MAVCKTCGSVVHQGDSFCPVCGQGLFNPEDALICSACETPNAPGTRFCKHCGAVLLRKPKTVQCPVCGSENAEDALYCTACGSEMPGDFEKEFEVESIEKLQAVLPLIHSYAEKFNGEFDKLSEEELKIPRTFARYAANATAFPTKSAAVAAEIRTEVCTLQASNVFLRSKTPSRCPTYRTLPWSSPYSR